MKFYNTCEVKRLSRLLRLTTLILILFSGLNPAFAQEVLVDEVFPYTSLAKFLTQWRYVGRAPTFSVYGQKLNLGNTLAVNIFGLQRPIASNQNWTLSCDLLQTHYKRGQWFGLFTEDQCHGYLMRWDSEVATSDQGNGRYSIYKYDSATPVTDWNISLGSLLASSAGVMPALSSAPTNFSLVSIWNEAKHSRQITMTETCSMGTTAILRGEVLDTNSNPYTRILLGGNSTGIFSNLNLVRQVGIYNVKSYGAAGDGITDDTASINSAITAAQPNHGSVYFPATTKFYKYSSCLRFKGITVYGDGEASLLQAADPNHSAVILSGQFSCLKNLKITSPQSVNIGRQIGPETAGVVIDQALNFLVKNVSIDTVASVGIISLGGVGQANSPSLIHGCTIKNPLADGIHLTQKSCYINLVANDVTNSGDDMFAVVSYTRDEGLCHDIQIIGNLGDLQSSNGRGVSVVGGKTIDIIDNDIEDTRGAAVYLQSELVRNLDGSLLYKTFGDDHITVESNYLSNAASTVFHGAINLGGRPADGTDLGQMETSDMMVTNVTISDNTIKEAFHSGICLQGYFDHVSIEDNLINTTIEQGIYVFGGSNLFIGDKRGNTFKNIGTYGIYTGICPSIPTFTGGTILMENNIFDQVNILGTVAIPVISIGSATITGDVSDNQFDVSNQYPLLTPYVRFGVQ